MCRRLCLSRRRARSAFPPSACRLLAPRSLTQRLPPPWCRWCVLNVITLLRSLPFESATRACLPPHYLPVPGAAIMRVPNLFYDTVVLGRLRDRAGLFGRVVIRLLQAPALGVALE